jgi:flagellar basal body rod protein FlgC
VGCNEDFLDTKIDSNLTKDRVFVSYDYTSQFVVGTYAWLPQGLNRIDDAMLASASDESEQTWEGSDIQRFNLGSWGVHSNPDDLWRHFYTGIRRVNLLLENIDQVDLETYELNPLPEMQIEYQQRVADLERWKYEMRVLRAYFYFELLKRYGGVPIITKTLTLEDDFESIPRNTIEEVVDFIVSECDEAASKLNTYPGRAANDANALGRMTKGAALAVKSRTLLYAASPLFLAPEDLSDAKPGNAEKWQLAAEAAKAVIDLGTGVYDLEANYSNVFNNHRSKELIIAYRYGATNTFERANYSVGYEQGRSGTTPSQNLVNAYEMTNGKSIDDPDSGYDPQNPYANRDSRLSRTVIVNNSQWNGRTVELWEGGRDGKGKDQASKTGYYLKKYVVENLDLSQNRTQVHTWSLIRLAEIFLNYAEALNEYDPGNPDIAEYVNRVRQRSGMPALPDGLSQDEMRQRIRNERRVELAFEEHRYWDVRRWKIAPEVLGAPLMGMNIKLNEDQTFSYEEALVEERVFTPRMYWYPIPLSEIIKTSWSQNPQW